MTLASAILKVGTMVAVRSETRAMAGAQSNSISSLIIQRPDSSVFCRELSSMSLNLICLVFSEYACLPLTYPAMP